MGLQQFSVPNVERIAVSMPIETQARQGLVVMTQKKARQKAGLK